MLGCTCRPAALRRAVNCKRGLRTTPSRAQDPTAAFDSTASTSTHPAKPRSRNLSNRLFTAFDLRAPPSPPPAPFFQPIPLVDYATVPAATQRRNQLISRLRHALYERNPDPDRVWKALAEVLTYGRGAEGHQQDKPIPVALTEIRRAFTIIGRRDDTSLKGLQRLLVLVDLHARRYRSRFPLGWPSAPEQREDEGVGSRSYTGGRGEKLGYLDGAGAGLNDKEWSTILRFSRSVWRSPRPDPDLASSLQLLRQWTRSRLGRPTGEGGAVPPPKNWKVPRVALEGLLDNAVRTRSWSLFDALRDKLVSEHGIIWSRDAVAVSATLKRVEAQGAALEGVWARFEDAFVGGVLGSRLARQPVSTKGDEALLSAQQQMEKEASTLLWNQMMWIYGRRGHLELAMQMYRASQAQKPIQLDSLRPSSSSPGMHPPPSGVELIPPQPDNVTFSIMIQCLCHHGLLSPALGVMRDKVAMAPLGRKNVGPPGMHDFTAFFKGFAMHSTTGAGEEGEENTLVHLARMAARRRGGSNVDLGRVAAGDPYAGTRLLTARLNARDGPGRQSEWTEDQLEALYGAFLALNPAEAATMYSPFVSPATRQAGDALILGRSRSKLAYWLLTAYENVLPAPRTEAEARDKEERIRGVWWDLDGAFDLSNKKWKTSGAMARKLMRYAGREMEVQVDEGERSEEDGQAETETANSKS